MLTKKAALLTSVKHEVKEILDSVPQKQPADDGDDTGVSVGVGTNAGPAAPVAAAAAGAGAGAAVAPAQLADDGEIQDKHGRAANIASNFIHAVGHGKMDVQTEKQIYEYFNKRMEDLKDMPLEETKDLAFGPRALYLFSLDNPIRQLMIRIARSWWFDPLILLIIGVNCIFLALDDAPASDSAKGQMLWIGEVIFTVSFTVEMVIKVIAMGFYWNGPRSYLKDSWNVLDITVVVLGYLNYMDGMQNLTAVRTFRVLRPLRAIKNVRGMRILINSLLASLPWLFDVVMLFSFVCFIFGILGVQLYGGKLRQRCFSWTTGAMEETDGNVLCSTSKDVGRQCPPGFFCADSGESTFFNIIGFDNIAMAWVTIVQATSLEGWVDVMYNVQETSSKWNQLYFVALVMIGAMFVINLVTAVIFLRFEQSKAAEESKWEDQQSRKKQILKKIIMEEMGLNPNALAKEQKDIEQGNRDAGLAGDHQPGDAPDNTRPGFRKASSVTIPIERGVIEMTPQFAIHLLDKHSAGEPSGDDEAGLVREDTDLSIKDDDPAAHPGESRVWSRWVPNHELTWWQRWMVVPCRQLSDHPTFSGGIIVAIMLNTLFLSMDHFDASDSFELTLEISNYFFIAIFGLEMVIKLIGLGYYGYVADSFNIFDGIVVIISFIELGAGGGGGLSALRTCRLLRVFKLLRSWNGLDALLNALLLSIKDLMYFTCIQLLFMFIFAVMGMQLFRGKFTFEGETERANFDDFLWSVVTVFQIISGENWNEVMYSGVRAFGWPGSIYFIFLFIVGNYILLSTLLAIMLGNFEGGGDDDEPEGNAEDGKPAGGLGGIPEEPEMIAPNRGCCSRILYRFACWRRRDEVQPVVISLPGGDAQADQRAAAKRLMNTQEMQDAEHNEFLMKVYMSRHAIKYKKPKEPILIYGSSLWILPSSSELRRKLVVFVTHDYFEGFIFFLIAFSSLLLALDTPEVDSSSALGNFIFVADVIVTILFNIEMALKIFAFGFLLDKNSYCSSGWNLLDGFIVVIADMNLIFGGLSFFKSMRALRALRPLRVVSRFDNMRIVVQSIMATVPALGNVLAVTLLFFIIFAIVGVQFFKGRLRRCTYPGVDDSILLGLDEGPCIAAGYKWDNVDGISFDNVGAALLVLFEVSSLEMWPGIMMACIDSTSAGEAPIENNVRVASIYFILFIIVGSFFVVGLFTGVVVDEYKNQHDQFTGSLNLTELQRQYLDAYREMLYNQPPVRLQPAKRPFLTCMATEADLTAQEDEDITKELLNAAAAIEQVQKQNGAAGAGHQGSAGAIPVSVTFQAAAAKIDLSGTGRDRSTMGCEMRLRYRVFDIVKRTGFDMFIMAVIILNILVMSLEYYQQPDSYTTALDVMNDIFSFIFVIEMILKWLGLGVKQYFRDNWNRFDFIIVVISLFSFIMRMAGTTSIGIDATVFRVFRVLRIFRLVKRAKGIRALLQTLVFSIPSLWNVGILLILLLFIYAVAGMNLFGKVILGEALTVHANFRNFETSMITLFRMATGESWNGIMHDCMVQEPFCSEALDNCGNPGAAVFFFTTFWIFSSLLMLNVFVAVVLNNFEEEVAKDPEFNTTPVPREAIIGFGEVWADMTPSSQHLMPAVLLGTFLNRLAENEDAQALAPPRVLSGGELIRLMRQLDVPQMNAQVHYLDVCLALTIRRFNELGGCVDEIPIDNQLLKAIRLSVYRLFPILKRTKEYRFSAAHVTAATLIQARFRNVRHHLKSLLDARDQRAQGGMHARRPSRIEMVAQKARRQPSVESKQPPDIGAFVGSVPEIDEDKEAEVDNQAPGQYVVEMNERSPEVPLRVDQFALPGSVGN